MIDAQAGGLSMRRQCTLLGVSRSSVYFQSRERSSLQEDTELANEIHRIWLSAPFYGYRRIGVVPKKWTVIIPSLQIHSLWG